MPPTCARFLVLNAHIANRLTLKRCFQVVTQNRHLEANFQGNLP